MKKTVVAVAVGLSLLSVEAQSRNTKLMLPLKEVLEKPAHQQHINKDIKLYFGDQRHPKPSSVISEKVVSNKKTNAFNKEDKEACEWVFLSSIKALQAKAQAVGANAVINIESFYKKQPNPSRTEYECRAGAFVAGVSLRGDLVVIGR